MNNIANDAKGIKGKRFGGEPENEIDHFYRCQECSQSVDKRDLGQVFHHEEFGHKPILFQ